jgi:hypothetical protein
MALLITDRGETRFAKRLKLMFRGHIDLSESPYTWEDAAKWALENEIHKHKLVWLCGEFAVQGFKAEGLFKLIAFRIDGYGDYGLLLEGERSKKPVIVTIPDPYVECSWWDDKAEVRAATTLCKHLWEVYEA